MKNWMWYVFLLILVFLVVVYYKGSSSVAGTGGTILDRTILYLQGRNSSGNVAAYPQG